MAATSLMNDKWPEEEEEHLTAALTRGRGSRVAPGAP